MGLGGGLEKIGDLTSQVGNKCTFFKGPCLYAHQLSSFLSSEVTWQLLDGDLERAKATSKWQDKRYNAQNFNSVYSFKALNIS